jgi:hypothetical protein
MDGQRTIHAVLADTALDDSAEQPRADSSGLPRPACHYLRYMVHGPGVVSRSSTTRDPSSPEPKDSEAEGRRPNWTAPGVVSRDWL